MSSIKQLLSRLDFKSGYLSILLFGVLLVSGASLLIYQPLRPNFYQPARPSLTEAMRHLSSLYADERVLLQELGETRQQLRQTLHLLSKAEHQLPAEQQRSLQHLSERIHRLGSLRAGERMTPKRLHEIYRQSASELNDLIHSLG